jgi:hypothetical protein
VIVTIWRITDAEAARDLRVDADMDVRQKIKDATPAAPDFTQLRGPGNRITRRLAGRNN